MSFITAEKKQGLGFITLNSAKTLNSLTVPMIDELHALLKEWRKDNQVSCVFLQGSWEKAFCAGGDVRRLYESIIEQRKKDPNVPSQECLHFFEKEYRLDFEIHRYPKPVVVWGDGIVMGGGIGLMVGASHRIVTENSKLAMPEITIGLYPDVGATWFLNRMPKGWGEYLGLTGARLNAGDCLYLGIADYFIPSSSKNRVMESLMLNPWSGDLEKDKKTLTILLKDISNQYEHPHSPAKDHEEFVARMSECKSVKEFLQKITDSSGNDAWISAGIKSLRAGSPSSAFIIFEQLRRGKGMSLDEVFRSEMNLSVQCALHPDFAEGVRALLVDKDNAPKWDPKTFDDVTTTWIESYFNPVWKKEEHPLFNLGGE